MVIHNQKQFVQCSILIADDSPEWIEIIEAAIGDMGHQIFTANTAEEGLRKSQNFYLNLAIVDVFMPGEGGIWIIEQLRKTQPGAKIISISGGLDAEMNSDDALLAAQKIGADYVMAKPLSIKKLRALVTEALAA